MIDFILHFAAALYIAGTAFLSLFITGFVVLLVIYLLRRKQVPQAPDVADQSLLSVTIQLPVYNEPDVVDRLLDACAQLDYPTDKLYIQILDDSTDHTSELVAAKVCELRAQGLQNISHIHRRSRAGYKAGALAYGMRFVTTDCVAIFDADFVPTPDFLRRTMPFFHNRPRLGLIQTRWGHINHKTNWLTRAQALNIDAHFAVEQVARSRGHLPMSMNGTGGVWRVNAIQDAGGWSAATLTEDFDLSYRAFLRGWEFEFLVDVVVPGELPPLIQVYKRQQARWAMGSTQCLLRHARALITCQHCSFLNKFMGLLHLSQYVVQPVILMLFLLTPLLMWGNALPDLRLMAVLGAVPPLLIIIAQIDLYPDWPRRILYFPVTFLAAIAIGVSNSWAVLRALWNPKRELEFKRTPKFRLTPRSTLLPHSLSGLRLDMTVIGELLLALYAMYGLRIALHTAPPLAPYMLTYASAFLLFAGWNLYQTWKFGTIR